jgi:branched-chain amino acid transport system ATP-binding protein
VIVDVQQHVAFSSLTLRTCLAFGSPGRALNTSRQAAAATNWQVAPFASFRAAETELGVSKRATIRWCYFGIGQRPEARILCRPALTDHDMLEIDALETAYGRSQVLFGLSLRVAAGEVATLLGRNGMGKTTAVKSIMGIVAAQAGSIRFEGRELRGQKPHSIAQAGLGLVPEGRQIFPNLSVRENLVATARAGAGGDRTWTLERIFELFPRIAERQRNMGSQLSGGEQQMLAIGRALLTNPRLLILDEATEGLAPLIRQEIWSCLAKLKQAGQAILLIDKNLAALLKLADSHHIVEKGRIVWQGNSAEFVADPQLQHRYLGV